MEKLINKTNDLINDGKATFNDAVSTAKDSFETGKIKGAVKDTMESFTDFAKDSKKQISAKSKELSEIVDKHAHTKPWAYIAGAALLGATMGYLLRSKNRE